MVLVDIRETKSVKAADVFLQVRPGKDFELITILRAMIKDQPISEAQIAETGLTMDGSSGTSRFLGISSDGIYSVLGTLPPRGAQEE